MLICVLTRIGRQRNHTDLPLLRQEPTAEQNLPHPTPAGKYRPDNMIPCTIARPPHEFCGEECRRADVNGGPRIVPSWNPAAAGRPGQGQGNADARPTSSPTTTRRGTDRDSVRCRDERNPPSARRKYSRAPRPASTYRGVQTRKCATERR
jgi:hypothetical protein